MVLCAVVMVHARALPQVASRVNVMAARLKKCESIASLHTFIKTALWYNPRKIQGVRMKRSLVIVSGEIGQHFLEQLIETETLNSQFHIVCHGPKIRVPLTATYHAFYHFDPTSYSKLSQVLSEEFVQVMIAMDHPQELQETIKNIRIVRRQLRIALIDAWNLHIDDPNISIIKSKEVLCNRLLNYLPDLPITAQNVGLAKGEIMDVLVPFGSSYVYRHIATIRQKNWRITAIYRQNKMILATPKSMIQPNDRLLIVGEPPVLKSVFKAIKRQLGQFPAPFGVNLYLYIDLSRHTAVAVRKLMLKALYVHKKFSHKLYVRLTHPGDIALLNEIRAYDNDMVNIIVDYNANSKPELILEDVTHFNIGLVLIDASIFAQKVYRRLLFQADVPVLKIAQAPIEMLQEVVVAISDRHYVNVDVEKISTAVYDVSAQLDLRLTLFDFSNEQDKEQQTLIEHFENLSDIFSKHFTIIKSGHNPIRSLKKRENFLQCVPFNEPITASYWRAFFSTDMHKLFFKLDAYHQIFIPTRI